MLSSNRIDTSAGRKDARCDRRHDGQGHQRDQPNKICLADDQPGALRQTESDALGDPIAVVAAETRDQAETAAKAVKVEYEPLPVMMTPSRSPGRGGRSDP